jgi:phosphatidylinositol-3-phosphatase
MKTRNLSLLLAAAACVAARDAFAAGGVQTVWVIAMENHDFTQANPTASPEQILGNPAAPYINSLVTPGNPNAAQASYTTDYYNAGQGDHPSEPNYVWAEAGTNFNPIATGATTSTNQGIIVGNTITNDNDPSAASMNIFSGVPHLTGQMNAKGVTWNNYQEDFQILNSTTPTGGSSLVSKSGTSTTVQNPYYNTFQYNYAVKHNPSAFFSDTATQNTYTFDKLRSDIAADTVSVSNPTATNNFGQYNWITPNQFDDMHSAISGTFNYAGQSWTGDQSAIATGDNFLSIVVPAIMATQAYKNGGAIVLWWDETESTDSASTTLPEIIISPQAKGNAYTNSIVYSHSSDIKTMEEIFQLGGYLNNPITSSETFPDVAGSYATVAGANDLSDLFKAGVIPSTVPEPASLTVLGMGALALLARRKRA